LKAESYAFLRVFAMMTVTKYRNQNDEVWARSIYFTLCDGAQFFGDMNLVKAGKIHKLAASLYKPRGSKCGNKVAVYSTEITVDRLQLTWLYLSVCVCTRPLVPYCTCQYIHTTRSQRGEVSHYLLFTCAI
jgi:hypothetical protein